MSVENQRGMILTGENQRTWRETYPSASLSTTNPTSTDLSVNPGLCSERLVTDCLSHGTTSHNYNKLAEKMQCQVLHVIP
jgi:hypothetical protein